MIDGHRAAAIEAILIPTDLSPASLPGAVRAAELAQRLGARLIVMTAIRKPRTIGMAHAAYLDQAADTARMQLASWFARRLPAAVRHGLSVKFVAVVGTPADAILEAARAEAADLIVMTTHGRSGLKRLLHGSVAETVVRASPSPVLTVRTNGTPARTAVAA